MWLTLDRNQPKGGLRIEVKCVILSAFPLKSLWMWQTHKRILRIWRVKSGFVQIRSGKISPHVQCNTRCAFSLWTMIPATENALVSTSHTTIKQLQLASIPLFLQWCDQIIVKLSTFFRVGSKQWCVCAHTNCVAILVQVPATRSNLACAVSKNAISACVSHRIRSTTNSKSRSKCNNCDLAQSLSLAQYRSQYMGWRYREPAISCRWVCCVLVACFVAVNGTHLAISRKPQEAVACSAVQPSLSQASISAPRSTRNVTMSRLSSMQAYNDKTLRIIFHWRKRIS